MKQVWLVILLLVSGIGWSNEREVEIEITSTVFEEKRKVHISLPTGYFDRVNQDRRYPVLYLTDARAQMTHTASMIHYLQGGISEMIVVGIETPSRSRDFSPYDADGQVIVNPAEHSLLNFIRTEVKPLVARRYRTNSFALLSGHSLGGLFTLYSMLTAPELFDVYIALSPAMGWGSKNLLPFIEQHPARLKLDKTLIIATEADTPFEQQIPNFIRLRKSLDAHAGPQLNWQASLYEAEDHMTIAHIGLYDAVRYVFRNWWITGERIKGDKLKFDAHYQGLSERLGYEVVPEFNEMWGLTNYLVVKAYLEEAEYIVNKWIQYYPHTAEPYAMLSRVFMAKESPQRALEAVNEAIKLSVNDTRQLDRLKRQKDKIQYAL
ncbi:alpha/beta hydrolase [Pseudoalteromonas ardens]|uniref:alpha/beta hydrolase n=1 Tax=Pseudoalteromonas ardens TaxID=3048490 RepID=UPI0024C28D9A|nr:alpha/beta hydrolase-fold protein [Pseudoalteromonas sp. R96]MDK1309760.1 alpha/beta hydrolase-fold protein [Pseudoalteromonas sp. R96]